MLQISALRIACINIISKNLSCVMDSCHVLSFVVASWIDTPLRHSAFCPFNVAHFVIKKNGMLLSFAHITGSEG